MIFKDKICELCKKQFSPSGSRKKRCTNCLRRFCNACGKEYQARWNEFLTSRFCSPACSGKVLMGKNHHAWKGDKATYGTLHSWVRRTKGKASKCVFCNEGTRFEWANISGKYKRKAEDYMELCVSCHRRYDAEKRKSLDFYSKQTNIEV